jgi:hypothetical protein
MKRLKDALTGIEFRRLVESRAPIHLRDLSPGVIVRYAPDDSLIAQVDGEADARSVSIGNIYVKDSLMIEVLPAYTDAELHTIHKKLNAMPDDAARYIIDCLNESDLGFDIEHEDYRTVQGEYHFTFDFHLPQHQRERLIVGDVGHYPSWCAKWGHAWTVPEQDHGGDWRTTCRTCGIERVGDENAVVNVWSPPITGTFRPGQGFSWR